MKNEKRKMKNEKRKAKKAKRLKRRKCKLPEVKNTQTYNKQLHQGIKK